jgi:hypothetical protein
LSDKAVVAAVGPNSMSDPLSCGIASVLYFLVCCMIRATSSMLSSSSSVFIFVVVVVVADVLFHHHPILNIFEYFQIQDSKVMLEKTKTRHRRLLQGCRR